jgi:hypothetical protein
MYDELVDLGERARVEKEVDPLARGLLSGFVLAADALVAPAQLGRGVTPMQFLEALLEGHRG